MHPTGPTGVGVVFNWALADFLGNHQRKLDYIEVIPETLWNDSGPNSQKRYQYIPSMVKNIDLLYENGYPIVGHGIGLSLGSAMPLDEEHLMQVAHFINRYNVKRYSEHLGFSRVSHPTKHSKHLGLGMPVPCDYEALDLLCNRVARTTQVLEQSILLENGVTHTPYIEEEMPAPEFMNRICTATGGGILLDLHNLYTDFINNSWHPEEYISCINLNFVKEIHVAGGSMLGSAYTDSHSGPIPTPVKELLRMVIMLCKNLEGITFEFHDSVYSKLGPDFLRDEIDFISEAWLERKNHVI